MGNQKTKKKNNKRKKKIRSMEALSALMRNSSGPMKDKRFKRLGSKKNQSKKAIEESLD